MSGNRSTNHQQQCRLFALPPELRDLIYRFALVKGTQISPQRQSHRLEERSVLPFLGTCRRSRLEASKVYFGSNTFRFHDDGELNEHLPLFFRSLGPETLRLCTAISLESSLGPQHNRRCFSKYCVGSIRLDFSTIATTTTTTGSTNCCGLVAPELAEARERVQTVLLRRLDGHWGDKGVEARARLGSEVAIEFCETFEYLHPDYGD